MFWGVVLENGKRYAQKVESSYHLTMAALDLTAKKKGNTVSVVLVQNKTEFILCNLDYDKQTHQQLDLVFDADEEVTFYLNGEGTVHLSGYVLPDEFDDLDDESLDEEDESVDDSLDLASLNKLVEAKKRKHEVTDVASKKAKVDEKVTGKGGDEIAKKVKPNKQQTPPQQQKAVTPVQKKVEKDDEEEDSDEEESIDEEVMKKLLKDKSFDEDKDDDDDDDEDDDDFSDEDDSDDATLNKYKEEIKKQLAVTPKGIMKPEAKDQSAKKKVPQHGSPNKQQQQQHQNQKKQDGQAPQKGTPKVPQQQQSGKKQFDGKTPTGGKQFNQVNGKSPYQNKNKGGSPFSQNANKGSGKKMFKKDKKHNSSFN